jgi:hypothetical protein
MLPADGPSFRLKIVLKRLELVASRARAEMATLGVPHDQHYETHPLVAALFEGPLPKDTRLAKKRWRLGLAVRVLSAIDLVQADIEAGDLAAALDHATQAMASSFEYDADIGRRSRTSGAEGGKVPSPRRAAHSLWLDENRELMRRHPDYSLSNRARLIARKVGGNDQTIRKYLGSVKKAGK